MYQKIGDLMYEVKNLDATISYCKAHNEIIKDVPASDLVTQFFDRVARNTEGFATANLEQHAGIMDSAFNAFYVIDTFQAGRGAARMEPGVLQGTHVINFFVRPGRTRIDAE
jgi:hypothetical protein